MKRFFSVLIALIMVFSCAMCMTACGDKEDEAAEVAELEAELSQEGDGDGREVIKTIEGVDDDLDENVPLQISTIILYEDGEIEITPTDDLKKNEIKDDETTAVSPFKESGKAKDVWVVRYGNEGYRTILALMEDGTISAVNGSALVEDHIFAVMDNVSGRDNFTSVENEDSDEGTQIIGITEDGERVVLDYSLNL